MLELGSSGSVRGVSSDGHPYRDPGPKADPTTQAACAFLAPRLFSDQSLSALKTVRSTEDNANDAAAHSVR